MALFISSTNLLKLWNGELKVLRTSFFALLYSLSILLLLFTQNVMAAAVVPFACDGRYYQTIRDPSNDFILFEVETNPVAGTALANLTANGLPSNNANATAYNPQDNFIYMSARFDTGDGEGNVLHIYKIDSIGGLEEVGVPKIGGVTAINTSVNAGAFLFNGTYIIGHGASQTIYTIDLATMVATNIGTYTGSIPDFAVHPITGELYGWNTTGRILSRIELDDVNNPTAVTGTTNIGTGNTNYLTMGAAYFNADGTMIAYGDDNTDNTVTGQETLVSINVTTGVLTELGTGPGVSANDGASCPYYLDLKKTASVGSLTLGGAFYYTFEIINASTITLNNVTFSDVLVDGFLWNSEPRNLLGGVVIGATSITGTANAAFNITTIPPGTSSFEIEVLVPNSVTSTEYVNVATLGNLPLALGSTTESDDGATSTLGDATRTSINTTGDTDGDGIDDAIDLDDDNDGISDLVEGTVDSDGDGLIDSLDPDSDNDGISDQRESLLPLRVGNDADNDGIDDAYDVDQTGGVDANVDGIDDRFTAVDTDNDGIEDRFDLDSDNDGYLDSIENGDYNNDGISDHQQIDPGLETALDGHGAGSLSYSILLMLLAPLIIRSKDKSLTFILVFFGLLQTAQAVQSCGLNEEGNFESCWYLGGAIGLGRLEPDDSRSTWRVSDENSTAYNIYAGYQFKPNWFAEIDYADLGGAEVRSRNPAIPGSEEITYKIPSLFAGYVFGETDQSFNFYGKLGVSNIINKTSNSRVPYEEQTSTQVSIGAGLIWSISNQLKLRVDATSYDDDAKYLNIGLSYSLASKRAHNKPSIKTIEEDSSSTNNNISALPEILEVKEEACEIFEDSLVGVIFKTNSYVLTNDSYAALDNAVSVLQQYPQISVIIEGHTDSNGPELRNYNLSRDRATAVMNYFINKGIATQRVQVKSYGETRLILNEQGTEDMKASRRVELISMQTTSCNNQ